MALVQAVRALRRPPYLKRAFLVDQWRGQLRARAWPPHRRRTPTGLERRLRENLTAVVRFQKTVLPVETVPMREALAIFLRKHRGLRGSAATRFRDLETQRFFGRGYAVHWPDGSVWVTEAMVSDVSDTLNMIAWEPGAVVMRGANRWESVTFQPGDPVRSIG